MSSPGGAQGAAPPPDAPDASFGLIDRLAAALAIAGGAILAALSAVVTAGVLGRWILGREITGAFEIVQIGVAVAAFLFLPICQLNNGNITVETFTARAPRRVRAGLDAFWALAYAAVALVLAWLLATGAAETLRSHMVSTMLQLPFGWAMAVGAAALAFLSLASLVVAIRFLKAGGR